MLLVTLWFVTRDGRQLHSHDSDLLESRPVNSHESIHTFGPSCSSRPPVRSDSFLDGFTPSGEETACCKKKKLTRNTPSTVAD